ncbi:lysozyme [Candidatus Liberibacter solanacearum]|uniref:Lysozyme n=2 Tax=Candidatus Liberibacter solanacearum TaxID=556287 RepID=A0A3R7NIX0_9HYPH|nr:lysozyme [Candidatus Liberibacter solanacearum]RPD37049.1 lysozyme [Candidatus Liberibacter solanacearum]
MRNIPSLMIELIKKFEGLRLKAYLDSVGVLTIGYGHTGPDVYADMSITLQQADDLLMQDAAKSLDSLFAVSPTVESAGENRISAIGDFVFNLGIGNYNKSTFKKCVDTQDWMNASQECKRWVHAGGKQLKGLVVRREAEAKLLLES